MEFRFKLLITPAVTSAGRAAHEDEFADSSAELKVMANEK